MRAQIVDRRETQRALRQLRFDRAVGVERIRHAVDHARLENFRRLGFRSAAHLRSARRLAVALRPDAVEHVAGRPFRGAAPAARAALLGGRLVGRWLVPFVRSPAVSPSADRARARQIGHRTRQSSRAAVRAASADSEGERGAWDRPRLRMEWRAIRMPTTRWRRQGMIVVIGRRPAGSPAVRRRRRTGSRSAPGAAPLRVVAWPASGPDNREQPARALGGDVSDGGRRRRRRLRRASVGGCVEARLGAQAARGVHHRRRLGGWRGGTGGTCDGGAGRAAGVIAARRQQLGAARCASLKEICDLAQFAQRRGNPDHDDAARDPYRARNNQRIAKAEVANGIENPRERARRLSGECRADGKTAIDDRLPQRIQQQTLPGCRD